MGTTYTAGKNVGYGLSCYLPKQVFLSYVRSKPLYLSIFTANDTLIALYMVSINGTFVQQNTDSTACIVGISIEEHCHS